jgi:hypothetical protein
MTDIAKAVEAYSKAYNDKLNHHASWSGKDSAEIDARLENAKRDLEAARKEKANESKVKKVSSGHYEQTINGHKVEAVRMDLHSDNPADARTWILAIDEVSDDVYYSLREAFDAASRMLN